MKWIRRLLVPVVVCSWPVMAFAADLPTKNPPTVLATPGYPTGSGWWWGLGAETDIANDTVASQSAGTNLYAVGAGVVGVVGYNFKLPSSNWASWELGFTYQNLGGSQSCGAGIACTISSNWDIESGVSFGFPWTAPFALFPSLSGLFGGNNPSNLLPTGVAFASSLPYIGAYAHFDDVSASFNQVRGSDWLVTPSLGIGLKNAIANSGGVIDVRVEESFPNTGFSIGPNTVRQGYVTRLKAVYEY